MSVNTTGKDFMLAVLFIPLMFPLLLGAVCRDVGGHRRRTERYVPTFWTAMAFVGGLRCR